MRSPPRPIVLLPACERWIDGRPLQSVRQQYLDALHAVGLQALVVPTSTPPDWDRLLPLADGLLLTGSPSNIEPGHYGAALQTPELPLDPARDAAVLPLVPRVLASGLPLLAICRGFQEMNVAYGGTLWQHVHEQPGYRVHHEDASQPLDVQYGPVHEVTLTPGGVLAAIAGTGRITVNSLHHQGVRELGAGLVEEARADDGLIEAFRVREARRFAVAVQWHPEWKPQDNAFSTALFRAFGAAARERAAQDTNR